MEDSEEMNPLHGSDNPEKAATEVNYFFPVEHTLCAIKPHLDDKGNPPKEVRVPVEVESNYPQKIYTQKMSGPSLWIQTLNPCKSNPFDSAPFKMVFTVNVFGHLTLSPPSLCRGYTRQDQGVWVPRFPEQRDHAHQGNGGAALRQPEGQGIL